MRWLAAALILIAAALPARAQTPIYYVLKDSNGTSFNVLAFQCAGGVKLCPASVPIDSAGNPILGDNMTPASCSGTIAFNGTAQNAINGTSTVHGFSIANIDASTGGGEPLWISFTGTAAVNSPGSFPLPAPATTSFANMGSYTTPTGFGSNHALSVVAATAGHQYSCFTW